MSHIALLSDMFNLQNVSQSLTSDKVINPRLLVENLQLSSSVTGPGSTTSQGCQCQYIRKH